MKGRLFRICRNISLSLLVFLSAFQVSIGQSSASSNEETQAAFTANTSNGELMVYVSQSGQWVEHGSLAFDRFVTEKTLLLTHSESDLPVTLKLVKQGGGNAHLDSVFLGDQAPDEVNGDTGFNAVKLAAKDQDLIDIDEAGVVLSFPVGAADPTLKVAARIEGEHISKTPLQFPLSNTHKEISADSEFYTYSLDSKRGTIVMDGVLDEISSTEPFFKDYTIPDSGHPSGDTYGWVWNDDNNLYVNIDFTPDNTMDDDKDYAKVYILTDSGVKEFKVSVPETTWGQPYFTYTDKVGYQHKVYEFQIPFENIGLKEGQTELSMAFAGYGTASGWGITYTGDNDTELGLDGRDIQVDFNYSSGYTFDSYEVYLMPQGLPLSGYDVDDPSSPYQSIAMGDGSNELTAFSWTGTADITTDSTGAPLQSGVYDAYIKLNLLYSDGYPFTNLSSSYSITLSYELPGGDGTSEAEAYEISTAEQLNEVRNHLDSYFKLTADIDLTDYLASGGAGYNDGEGWEPIGPHFMFPFSGTFDGNGHTISGLMINDPTLEFTGLFGFNAGTIQNIGLEDVQVTGGEYVGGLVGGQDGALILNSYVTGEVGIGEMGSEAVGGLVGVSYDSLISNSYVTGQVKTSEDSTSVALGGLVGRNSIGTVSTSFSTANVTGGTREVAGVPSGDKVGGLAGENVGTVSDSYATGSVTGGYVGGLAGTNYYDGMEGSIANSYAAGSVSGENVIGGLLGVESGDTTGSFYNTDVATGTVGIGISTSAMQTQSTYEAAGWDFAGTWKIDPLHNNGYPYLQAIQAFVTYDGNGGEGEAPSDSNSYNPSVTEAVYVLGQGDLEKIGHSFGGWYITEGGTMYEEGDSFVITDDTTLYAQWNLEDYTVTFESNGGHGIDPITASYGGTINAPATTREGYSFGGWNTAADGSGASYAAGDDISVPASDITLYAQWLSSNAMLSDLTVSEGTLDFNPDQAGYTVDVPNSVESLDLTITLGDPSQSITVTGAVYQSVTGSVYDYRAANLAVGPNLIHIQVSAQDGTVNDYNVNIQRLSNNADLSELLLSSGTLSPTFLADTTEYTASVPNDVSSLTVTASVTDSHAAMTVNGIAAASGAASDAISLNVGANTIPVVVTAQDGTTKTYTITVTRAEAPSTGGGGGGGGAPTGGTDQTDETEPADNAATNDGNIGPSATTVTTSERDGKTILTATIDAVKLIEQLETAEQGAVVSIPVTEVTDQVSAVLTGDAVQAMESKDATLDIQSPIGGYKLPASEVKLDLLAMLLGAQGQESEVSVQVDIAKSDEAKVGLMWDAASRSGFTVVVPPVDFTVTASVGDRSVTVDTFSSFVEREIPIPEGIDAGMITSAVVLNEDGTTRSVPMKIVTRDGVSYAVINSLTNSTYTLVSHTAAFSDVENHWAKDAVNGMGSRMVINGTGDGLFSPDQAITRAEFAAIVVRSLGMKLEASAGDYSDVKAGDWYSSAVNAADAYDLISGFGDGTFRPNDKITREEAMVIIARAMAVTGLDAELSGLSTEETLGTYQDAAQVSAWAQSSVAEVIASGIVSGRSGTELAPMANITRAEVAVVIERLLAQSGLI